MPIKRKMAAHHKRAVSKVMKAARKRKPTAKRVSFTKTEKSTLRHVMTQHSRKRKSPAARKRKSPAKRKVSARRLKTPSHMTRKRIKSPVRKRKSPASRAKKARKSARGMKDYKRSAALIRKYKKKKITGRGK